MIPVPELKKFPCWNQPGTRIRTPRPVPECSSTGLTKLLNARMPMQAASASMPMPIYGSQNVFYVDKSTHSFFYGVLATISFFLTFGALVVDWTLVEFHCLLIILLSFASMLQNCTVICTAQFLFLCLCFCFFTHQISEDTRGEYCRQIPETCYLN